MSDIVGRAKAALEGVTDGPWSWAGDSFSDVKPHECPHGTQWTDHGPDLRRVTDSEKWAAEDDVITSGGYDASSLDIKRADAEFIAAARELVPELVAEVEKLRAGGPWAEHVERMNAMKRERDGECICDGNPETTNGPEEFCPWHGRPYTELVDIIVRQQAEIVGLGQ